MFILATRRKGGQQTEKSVLNIWKVSLLGSSCLGMCALTLENCLALAHECDRG